MVRAAFGLVRRRNNAVGIGPASPVTVTFSKPMDPSTLYQNMALFVGSVLQSNFVSLSPDSTTATFNVGRLSYGTAYTVVVCPNVAAVYGNPLGSEFPSTFASVLCDNSTLPSVSAFRPAHADRN